MRRSLQYKYPGSLYLLPVHLSSALLASAIHPSMEREQPWRRSFLAWPPRSYPCSFCKREFRSAQALGGHMNVHRRDRARLRHAAGSPPPAPPPPPAVPNLNYPPPPPQYHHRDGGGKKRSWMTDDLSLELGVGVLMMSSSTTTATTTPTADHDDDAGLDLELRLGVSS